MLHQKTLESGLRLYDQAVVDIDNLDPELEIESVVLVASGQDKNTANCQLHANLNTDKTDVKQIVYDLGFPGGHALEWEFIKSRFSDEEWYGQRMLDFCLSWANIAGFGKMYQ